MDFVQEEVIVHSGSTSPPAQSHFVTSETNAQLLAPLASAIPDICSAGGTACEQLLSQQFSSAPTTQIYNPNYRCSTEGMTNMNDETQFATSSAETFRVRTL